jgi:flagellar basal-body rod protein FlgC
MIAQRTRLEAITMNIVNQNTFLDENGRNNPFQRRVVMLAPADPRSRGPNGRAMGVRVAAIEQEAGFTLRHEPTNPYADERGYVKYPNINSTFEQVNAFAAQRSYEANVAVAEATKQMMTSVLRLLA